MVAGTAGGRRLAAPRCNPGVRPTTDRVREAVFAALTSLEALEGARVLDLFAGSGALGIEALSRGAASATFVDSHPAAVAAVRANLAATGLGGSRARVVRAEAARFLATDPGPWDLALLDPPYGYEGWPDLLAGLDAALVVAEAARPPALGPGWVVTRSRAYGGTVVTFASPSRAAPWDPGPRHHEGNRP